MNFRKRIFTAAVIMISLLLLYRLAAALLTVGNGRKAEVTAQSVVLQAADMAVFQLSAKVVHHLFKRLHLVSDAQVVGDVSVDGTLDILDDSIGDDLQLVYALR